MKREKVGEAGRQEGATEDFRIRQLRARDMLRGDLDAPELEKYVEERVLTTTLDKAVA
ncbi:MAG: NADH-quinone oxidoreductase subunit, partial [Solirubrobacteraceae bacterium]|nr:NADH-quinone oxidoreductase subunit [Solirubrobacteraceae bacterium]